MPKRSTGDVLGRLLRPLLSAKEPLSTREVARQAGVDWKTAEKFLSYFHELSGAGGLVRLRRPQLTLWRLVPVYQEVLRIKLGKEWVEEVATLADKAATPKERLEMWTSLTESVLGLTSGRFKESVRRMEECELELLRIE